MVHPGGCSAPFERQREHWLTDAATGEPMAGRVNRPASYGIVDLGQLREGDQYERRAGEGHDGPGRSHTPRAWEMVADARREIETISADELFVIRAGAVPARDLGEHGMGRPGCAELDLLPNCSRSSGSYWATRSRPSESSARTACSSSLAINSRNLPAASAALLWGRFRHAPDAVLEAREDLGAHHLEHHWFVDGEHAVTRPAVRPPRSRPHCRMVRSCTVT